MKGRKPIPTELKRLAGNPGRRPLNQAEPQAPHGAPEPPAALTGEARDEWDRVTAELDAMNLLHETDRAALALYCEQWRQWTEAVENVKKNGLIVKMPNGWPQPNPYLAIVTRTTASMKALLTEFGLTPSSRSRVKAQPGGDEADDFLSDL